jgi:hypothetical protein
MANNTHRYGFRWVGSADGSCYPKPQEFLVASGYHAQVSATDVDLNIGDPVQFNVGAPGSGFIELAAVGATPNIFWGVIVGFSNVKVGLPLAGRKFSRLPAGTTWSLETDASKVLVVPFGRNYWEIDVTGNTSSTDTLTEYRAQVNRCANLIYTLDATDASKPKANPMLDISTVTDDTADFRIVNVSKTALNQDYSGNFVKLIVQVNESGEAPFVTDPGV